MDKSKSISMIIAKLKVAYPSYFRSLTDEEFVGLINMYQETLSEFNEETLQIAVANIITNNKFYPTVKEIIDECKKYEEKNKYEILEIMKKDGYFKKGDFGELSYEQEIKNYEKAQLFVERGVIPSWLKEDMDYYSHLNKQLENSVDKLLSD